MNMVNPFEGVLAVDLAAIAPVVDLALHVAQKLGRETMAQMLRYDRKTRVHDACGCYRLQDSGNGCEPIQSVHRVFVGLRVEERHLGVNVSHGMNAASLALTKPPMAAADMIIHLAPFAA